MSSSPPTGPDVPTSSATLAAVQTDLAAWHIAHPQATFADLEAAVEAGVARLRASLLRDRLPTDGGASDEEGPARPACAACAVPLVARGRHRRQVQVWGDDAIELERRYWTCPRCGAGHFPPG
jgi:hypothetical protein